MRWLARNVRRVGPLVAALALGALAVWGGLPGCATRTGEPPPWRKGQPRRVWPAAPDRPRIEYLGAIHTAEDLGRRVGAWQRLLGALVGRERATLVRPVAVAGNRAGLRVVTDPGVPTVHFFDLERREYRQLDGELAARLRFPVGAAVDDRGRVFVADSGRKRVFVFDGARHLVAEWGEGILERPTGLALSPDQDRLYVVDTLRCRVVAFDRAGHRVGSFGRRGVGAGQFNYPTYVAVAPDGTLVVADSLNFRVQRFRSDGTPLGSFGRPGDGGGDFSRPKGIATDASGRLYVVDAAFENVQIFDPAGRLLLAFSEPGSGPGQLYLPSGLYLHARSTIWVADSFNRRVQLFRLLSDGEQ